MVIDCSEGKVRLRIERGGALWVDVAPGMCLYGVEHPVYRDEACEGGYRKKTLLNPSNPLSGYGFVYRLEDFDTNGLEVEYDRNLLLGHWMLFDADEQLVLDVLLCKRTREWYAVICTDSSTSGFELDLPNFRSKYVPPRPPPKTQWEHLEDGVIQLGETEHP